MAPPKLGSTPVISMADAYSFADDPKPFKNLGYKRDIKRSKSVKQIMALERDRVDTLAKAKRDKKREALERGHAIMEVDEDNAEVVTYSTVEAPPSLVPSKKYCDVTGLEAPYIDPKSNLRYHNIEVYEVVKTFGPGVIQSYLSLRGKGAIIR